MVLFIDMILYKDTDSFKYVDVLQNEMIGVRYQQPQSILNPDMHFYAVNMGLISIFRKQLWGLLNLLIQFLGSQINLGVWLSMFNSLISAYIIRGDTWLGSHSRKLWPGQLEGSLGCGAHLCLAWGIFCFVW